MATSAQKSDHISRVRSAVDTILAGQDALIALRREWDALNLGSELTDEDFACENAGLTPANIASVYTTLEAIKTLMDAGHGTNLYTVSR